MFVAVSWWHLSELLRTEVVVYLAVFEPFALRSVVFIIKYFQESYIVAADIR